MCCIIIKLFKVQFDSGEQNSDSQKKKQSLRKFNISLYCCFFVIFDSNKSLTLYQFSLKSVLGTNKCFAKFIKFPAPKTRPVLAKFESTQGSYPKATC